MIKEPETLAAYAEAAARRIEAARAKTGAMEELRFGDTTVYSLFDAAGAFSLTLLPHAEEHPEWLAYMPQNQYPSIVKVFVIRCGERVALVDTGNGRAKNGRILENLMALGIKLEMVTDVLLTHLHGDHIGGLLDNGRAVFPNAVLRVSAPEYDAWITKGTETAAASIELARKTFAAYETRVAIFEFGETVFPNVRAVAALGHTSGHTRFDVATRTDDPKAGLTIAGDFLHIQPLQSRYTAASTRYDVHPEEAGKTREMLHAELAQSGRLVAGVHFDFIGRVKALDTGWAIEPA